MSDSFYPGDRGGQISWNTNIITELPGLAAELDIDAASLASILADCKMEVFLLTVVAALADSTRAELYGYVSTVEGRPTTAPGTVALPLPTLPVWPADAPAAVPPGIAARRSAWVATGKKTPGYNAETNGRVLRLEPTDTPFNPATLVADLKKVEAIAHETVQVTVGKAGGKVTAGQLQVRRGNGGAFATVAMFTGRVYLDHTPLAVPGVPEVREYQLLAMQNDVVIGHPSPILTVTVS